VKKLPRVRIAAILITTPDTMRNNPKYAIRKDIEIGNGVNIIKMTPMEIDTQIVIYIMLKELLSQAFVLGDFALKKRDSSISEMNQEAQMIMKMNILDGLFLHCC